MSSILNSDNIQECKNCEYCYPSNNEYYCGLKNEKTTLSGICKEYDYCNGDYYAGA